MAKVLLLLEYLIKTAIIVVPILNGIGVIIASLYAYHSNRNPIKWFIISLIIPFAFVFLFFSTKDGDFFNGGKNLKIKKTFFFLGHLFALTILVLDCIELYNIIKYHSIEDLLYLQIFFGIFCAFYICINDKNLKDTYNLFFLLAVAIIFPPSIIFFMLPAEIQRKFPYTKQVDINDIPVDELLEEFHGMFLEILYAESEKQLSNRQTPDSRIITNNSIERTGSYLLHKYHLSPLQLNEIMKLYGRTYNTR